MPKKSWSFSQMLACSWQLDVCWNFVAHANRTKTNGPIFGADFWGHQFDILFPVLASDLNCTVDQHILPIFLFARCPCACLASLLQLTTLATRLLLTSKCLGLARTFPCLLTLDLPVFHALFGERILCRWIVSCPRCLACYPSASK
jgi:hypothetical protein